MVLSRKTIPIQVQLLSLIANLYSNILKSHCFQLTQLFFTLLYNVPSPMHIFEFWFQNLVLGLWFWLKNFNMITREGRLFCKTIGNNDFSYCNSGKEESLLFLGHFIRLWFNEFLQENVEWSFRGFLFLKQETGRAKKKSYPTMTLAIAIRGKKSP